MTPEKRADRIVKRMPVELRRELDDVYLLSKMLGKKPNQTKAWQDWKGQAHEYKKALDATTAGGVDEWVPTDFSSELYQMVRLEAVVAKLFRVVTMPSNPYTFPIALNRLKSFKHTEQTGNTGQTKVPVADSVDGASGDDIAWAGNFTLTAEGHGTRLLMSKDAQEDSIAPLLAEARAEIVRVLSEGHEDMMLNGDIVSGTHEDTDVTAANDRRKVFTGLRALANDNSYRRDLSTLNISNLRLMRSDVGKYGAKPSRLAYITGVKGWLRLIDLAEVTTVDKYGPGATILSGELAKLDGIPIVVSEWVREDLNASAVYAAGQTKTALYQVYTDGYIIGERRQASIQLLKELYAESDQDALVVRERIAFRDTYPVASNKTIRLGANIA